MKLDYAHLNLEHFFARHDDLDVIRDRSEFVMINNFTNEIKISMKSNHQMFMIIINRVILTYHRRTFSIYQQLMHVVYVQP